MLWAEKKYDAETHNPDQSKHDPDHVVFNTALFDWYKKFIALRKQYKSIKLGSYTTLAIDDGQKLYAFSRKYESEEVNAISNRSNKPVSFTHASLKGNSYHDVFTKSVINKMVVNPMDVVVLAKKSKLY
jgi:glycosidase